MDRLIENLIESALALDLSKVKYNSYRLAQSLRHSDPDTAKRLMRLLEGGEATIITCKKED